ncbi:MarR family transcriptional regulator [Homoserinimonas aerilata]|uniref:MarR family transcriptional regulator n=1 Tax=Homoserinimonas aerilata TaxID=1162970 RepID=A0A542YGP2_9MICO|nr:MarR family transcriptional regulator [Homoserinimonas aerilata]TQL47262.1 MarR family transcriptional regulator [Homoserinimonas aerilata]
MSNDIRETLGELVGAAYRLSRVAARATGETTSALAYSALSTLIENGPLRVGELASLCRVSQPGMTKVVTALEEGAWVERVTDPLDARASVISITDAGRVARSERLARIGAAIGPYFEGLDPADRAALERAARILAERGDSARSG